MHPLTGLSEQAQELHRIVPGGTEPVRDSGVELGHLALLQDQVVIGDDQPQPTGQHVQPLVALVDPQRRCLVGRLDDHLPGLDPSGLAGERDHDPSVAVLGHELDPRVPDLRGADQLVERHLVGLGDREQQLEARLALTRLQAGQRALRDPGRVGQLHQRHAALLAHPTEPGTNLGQDRGERRRVGHRRS